jgi:hypothetical protein
VILELRDWIWRTPFQDNSGPNASWLNLDGVVTDINGDILKLERLKVSVWDKNTLSDTVLGRGTVSLRKAGTTVGADVSVTVQMKDRFGQTCGEVNLVLQVQDSTVVEGLEPDGSEELEHPQPTSGTFEVQEIQLSNLRNTGPPPSSPSPSLTPSPPPFPLPQSSSASRTRTSNSRSEPTGRSRAT